MQEEQVKLFIKRRAGFLVPILRPLYDGSTRTLASFQPAQRLHRRLKPRDKVFRGMIESRVWAFDETVCGRNSTVASTPKLRASLAETLRRLEVKSMIDAPCGDWAWMQHVDLGDIDYRGFDIVPDIIKADQERFGGENRKFTVADIAVDPLPRADLVLSRDCLIHLSFDDAGAALANFVRSGSTYLASTTYPGKPNRPIFTGQWQEINLEAPPFNFPPPIDWIQEDDLRRAGKSMGIWRLDDLRMN